MHLRLSTMADAAMLLEWRNDPVTRSMSLSTEPVALDKHMNWLQSSLLNPVRKLYIGERDGVAVGTLRADVSMSDGYIVISVTIAPAHRRHGYGSQITKAFAEMTNEHLYAEIKEDNIPSRLMCEAAGMHVAGRADNGLLVYRR